MRVLHGGGWRPGTPFATDDPLYLQATTACLVAIVLMQSINVFICRSQGSRADRSASPPRTILRAHP
ncbi:MAG TPA: hypothetical protein PL143_03370 [Rhodocyclaceae bacterium]|nr:hypothetical protein [Rhodocyclaceae bacterium]